MRPETGAAAIGPPPPPPPPPPQTPPPPKPREPRPCAGSSVRNIVRNLTSYCIGWNECNVSHVSTPFASACAAQLEQPCGHGRRAPPSRTESSRVLNGNSGWARAIVAQVDHCARAVFTGAVNTGVRGASSAKGLAPRSGEQDEPKANGGPQYIRQVTAYPADHSIFFIFTAKQLTGRMLFIMCRRPFFLATTEPHRARAAS